MHVTAAVPISRRCVVSRVSWGVHRGGPVGVTEWAMMECYMWFRTSLDEVESRRMHEQSSATA